MNITNFTFKYPTPVITIYLIIILFGLVSISQLSVQNLPNINIPVFGISVLDQGLSIQKINTSITQPIQKWVEGLKGVKQITGKSYNNFSMVGVAFELGTDSEKAYLDLQKKMNKNVGFLPKSASSPILSQIRIQNTPIIWIIIQSMHLSSLDLSNVVQTYIQPQLENISGVAALDVIGSVPKKIRVELNQDKMSALGVPLDLIYQAFQKENVLLPGGEVEDYQNSYSLMLDLSLHSLDNIRSLIVAYRDTKPIYLSQVAHVELQKTADIAKAYYNNKPVIAIGVLRTEEANEIDVIQTVKNTLKNIKAIIPHDITLITRFSEAESIKNSTTSLMYAMFFGLIFAILIVFLFLGDIRISLVILIVVTVAMLASIIAMRAFNLNANMLTLSSLIVLICLVVDDTIIVIENYMYDLAHKPKQLKGPLAIYSTDRIKFSIAAYTICLCIIFLSATVTEGIVKIFFTNMSVVIVSGVLVSAFTCITLAPLIFQKFITKNVPQVYITKIWISLLARIQAYYVLAVEYTLKKPSYGFILFLCILLPLPFLVPELNENLFPKSQNYDQLNVKIRTLESTPALVFQNHLLKAEQIIRAHPDIAYTLGITRDYPPDQAEITVKLKPVSKRKYSFPEILNQLQTNLDNVAGFLSYVTPPPVFSGATQPLDFRIIALDYNKLSEFQRKITPLFDKHPNLGRIYSVGTPLQPVYKLEIDRLASAQVGLSAREIAQAVSLYGGRIRVGKTILDRDNQEYDIYLFPTKENLISPQDLRKIYLYNANGDVINLSSVAKIVLTTEPGVMQSYYSQPSLEFYSTPIIALSKARKELQAFIKTELKTGETLVVGGQAKQLKKVLHSLVMAIFVAIALIYFGLASQFNSFSLPIILLISQPIAVALVLYLLFITNIGINIFSILGLFLLIGIKTKNYILLINAMNFFFESLQNNKLAAIAACRERFRPIIMTSMVVLLAMLPTLFTTGVDRAQNIAMSGTIMLGIVTSTIFSLFFVPIAYCLFKKNPLNVKN